MQPIKQTTKVNGTTGGQRLTLLIVGLAVVFLGMMVVAGSQNATPTPTPRATVQRTPTTTTTPQSPTPTQPIALVPQRLYIQEQNYQGVNTINAVDLAAATPLFSVESDAVYGSIFSGAVLANDGLRLFVQRNNGISSIDATNGSEQWHQPLTEIAPSAPILNATYALWITPDDQVLINVHSNDTTITLVTIDANSGTLLKSYEFPSSIGSAFGVDRKHHVWFRNQDGLTLLDTYTALSQTLDFDATSPAVSAVTADGSQAIVFAGDGTLTTIDTATLQRTSTTLANTNVQPYSIKLAPHGEAIAILANDISQKTINAGRLEHNYQTKLLVGTPQHMTVVDDPQFSQINDMVWNSDGTQLYAVSGGGVFVYDRVRNISDYVQTTPRTGFTILSSNAVTWNPNNQPTLTPLPTFDFSTYEYVIPPTPTNLVQADQRDVAWLWHQDTRQLEAYRRDGTMRIMVDKVFRMLPRPQRKPLVLVEDSATTWSVYDDETQQKTPLLSTKPPFYGFYEKIDDVVLNPDQTQFAMIVPSDVIATDTFTHATQLLVGDINTGVVRVLGDRESLPALQGGRVVSWHDDTLYLVEEISNYYTSQISHLHQVDVRTGNSQEIRALPEHPLLLAVNAATGWMVTESYTNAEHAQLRLFNMYTLEDRIVHEGIFVDYDQVFLSPDGQQLVFFVRDSQQILMEHLSIATGKRRTIEKLTRTMVYPQSFAWSADSTRLSFNVYSSDFNVPSNQDNQYTVVLNDDTKPTQTSPHDRYIAVRAFSTLPQSSSMVTIDESFRPEATRLLQLYTSSDAPTPVVSLAINYYDRSVTSIVYVGE